MPSKYCDNTGRCAASNWCSTDYDPRREPDGECPYFHVLTNADKIRQMTDDELAKWIENIDTAFEEGTVVMTHGWLDWLKQEVKDDPNEART